MLLTSSVPSPLPSTLSVLSPPHTITSHGGHKNKGVKTVPTNEISQVMLPMLKSMSFLTKEDWIGVG
jgi:hypothetical protein